MGNIELFKASLNLFDYEGKTYNRDHNHKWFECNINIRTDQSELQNDLESEYQKQLEYKPRKSNQFIACVLKDNISDEIIIECNRIESNGNQTLIFGIMEDSTHGYDILLATMPSSEKVFLKMNK